MSEYNPFLTTALSLSIIPVENHIIFLRGIGRKLCHEKGMLIKDTGERSLSSVAINIQ